MVEGVGGNGKGTKDHEAGVAGNGSCVSSFTKVNLDPRHLTAFQQRFPFSIEFVNWENSVSALLVWNDNLAFFFKLNTCTNIKQVLENVREMLVIILSDKSSETMSHLKESEGKK